MWDPTRNGNLRQSPINGRIQVWNNYRWWSPAMVGRSPKTVQKAWQAGFRNIKQYLDWLGAGGGQPNANVNPARLLGYQGPGGRTASPYAPGSGAVQGGGGTPHSASGQPVSPHAMSLIPEGWVPPSQGGGGHASVTNVTPYYGPDEDQGSYQGGQAGYPWAAENLQLQEGSSGDLTQAQLNELMQQMASVAATEGMNRAGDAGSELLVSFAGTKVAGTPSMFPHLSNAAAGTDQGGGEWCRRIKLTGPAGSNVKLWRDLSLTAGPTWSSADTATTGQAAVSGSGAPRLLTIGDDGSALIILRKQSGGTLSHRWDIELTDIAQTVRASFFPSNDWRKPPIIVGTVSQLVVL